MKAHAGSTGYNLTTPHGRAVQHLLDRSALADDRGNGWDIVTHDDNGRSLIVEPAYNAWCSDGQAALLLFIESLLGQAPVVVGWVLAAIDAEQRRLVMEAVAIAAGFNLQELT